MQRAAMLDRATSGDPWDVAVVGGGATGLGVALDSALRGYRTILFDSGDFARGTSSRSTKLIHGGVRYLARGEFALVREALHERSVLLRNAPHLVRPLRFVIPAYQRWAKLYYGIGLWLYDHLAGRNSLGTSQVVGRAEVLRLAPSLREQGLRGGVVYQDAQFDDARLAIALARSSSDAGAVVLNYVRVLSLRREGERLCGLTVRDEETGRDWPISARVVVNAAGVFADSIRRMDEPTSTPILQPSRGIHLVFPRSILPGEAAVLIPKTDDGRVVFAIPWLGRVVVGTTDTPVDVTDIDPQPSESEVLYLIDHASRFLDRSLGRSDVLAQFAGLRPLLAKGATEATRGLSREHALFVSPSGLVTIVGGKWTTYRRMATQTVDRAAKVAGLPSRPCTTEFHRLHGADLMEEPLEPLSTYGQEKKRLQEVLAERPEWNEPIAAGFPNVMGEVVWAVRHEMARTVEDVLARRTRLLMLDARAASEAAARVAETMAEALGRNREWQIHEIARFREIAAHAIP